MKTMNEKTAGQQYSKNSMPSTSAKRGEGSNEISSGNVGTGGNSDNGAAELRSLRKKQVNDPSINRRKPLL